MAGLRIELPAEAVERLRTAAEQAGRTAEDLAAELVESNLPACDPDWERLSDREKSRRILRAAGLLTELAPGLKRRAEQCSVTLEEVSEMLSRGGGPSLSEIILEQRGPKDWDSSTATPAP